MNMPDKIWNCDDCGTQGVNSTGLPDAHQSSCSQSGVVPKDRFKARLRALIWADALISWLSVGNALDSNNTVSTVVWAALAGLWAVSAFVAVRELRRS